MHVDIDRRIAHPWPETGCWRYRTIGQRCLELHRLTQGRSYRWHHRLARRSRYWPRRKCARCGGPGRGNRIARRSCTVGGRRSCTVGSRRSRTVGSRRSCTVGSRRSCTVGSRRSRTVGGRRSSAVGGRRSRTVGSRERWRAIGIGSRQGTGVGGRYLGGASAWRSGCRASWGNLRWHHGCPIQVAVARGLLLRRWRAGQEKRIGLSPGRRQDSKPGSPTAKQAAGEQPDESPSVNDSAIVFWFRLHQAPQSRVWEVMICIPWDRTIGYFVLFHYWSESSST
ncbi:MAG: bacteriophage T4 gp5 trimerization domain-containing protein [Pirellulaceae bacterium]